MKRMLTLQSTIVFALLALLAGCGSGESKTNSSSPRATSSAVPTIPPVYVTIALHIEDTPSYTNCQVYPDFRRKLLQFAQAMTPYNAAFNLQTDYEFLIGVSRCETPAMQTTTNGQNVLDYLAAHYGYEIDAHQEGGWDIEGRDNYADIRYLAGRITAATSETMGGLVRDDSAQWATLTRGERGLLNPNFTWTPKALTLAVSSRHHLGDFSTDDYASGVWRPKGVGQDFWVHDPNGPLVYIGPGEYDNWGSKHQRRTTPKFVGDLIAQLEAGTIKREAMYTASLAVPQSVLFSPEEYAALQTLMDQIAPWVASGRVVYVTYSKAVNIWQSQYGAQPNIYIQR